MEYEKTRDQFFLDASEEKEKKRGRRRGRTKQY